VVGSLIDYYQSKHPSVKIIILSEYGISPVDRVVYVNKALREAGYLQVRKENHGETLDCGASDAFAMVDHQVAHVYLRNPERDAAKVRTLLAKLPGVQYVLDPEQQNSHYFGGKSGQGGAYYSRRSGDLLLVADHRSWFAYYYWLEPSKAPDFARCVAIHRKPGYDPAEMFFRFKPKWLGMLYLFLKLFLVYVLRIRSTVDASPIECEMIKGSHGRIPEDDRYKPVFITNGFGGKEERITAEQVHDLILKTVTGQE